MLLLLSLFRLIPSVLAGLLLHSFVVALCVTAVSQNVSQPGHHGNVNKTVSPPATAVSKSKPSSNAVFTQPDAAKVHPQNLSETKALSDQEGSRKVRRKQPRDIKVPSPAQQQFEERRSQPEIRHAEYQPAPVRPPTDRTALEPYRPEVPQQPSQQGPYYPAPTQAGPYSQGYGVVRPTQIGYSRDNAPQSGYNRQTNTGYNKGQRGNRGRGGGMRRGGYGSGGRRGSGYKTRGQSKSGGYNRRGGSTAVRIFGPPTLYPASPGSSGRGSYTGHSVIGSGYQTQGGGYGQGGVRGQTSQGYSGQGSGNRNSYAGHGSNTNRAGYAVQPSNGQYNLQRPSGSGYSSQTGSGYQSRGQTSQITGYGQNRPTDGYRSNPGPGGGPAGYGQQPVNRPTRQPGPSEYQGPQINPYNPGPNRPNQYPTAAPPPRYNRPATYATSSYTESGVGYGTTVPSEGQCTCPCACTYATNPVPTPGYRPRRPSSGYGRR